METIYSPKDVAGQLEIQLSTLRKYSELLEKSGYGFHKNERGHRGYYDGDVMALRKFMELKERSGMSLEMAAKGVISWSKGTDMAVNATQELTPHKPDMNDIQTLHEMINEQSELIDKQNDLLKMVVGKLVELEGRQKSQEERFIQRESLHMNAIESLQQQHKFITERSEQTNKKESKRDEQLAQLIQEVKETRKQIAAAEEKKEKSFWARLLGK